MARSPEDGAGEYDEDGIAAEVPEHIRDRPRRKPHDGPEAIKLGPNGMALIETVNVLECAVGQRGWGKSTTLSGRAYELSTIAPAHVVGHSLGARMPSELPDGTELPIKYHRSMVDLANAHRRHPELWHILCTDEADPVLHYARDLSLRVRERAWRDAGKLSRWGPEQKMTGIEAPFVIAIVDEGIALSAASGRGQAREENKWLQEMMFSLRHEHIAMYYSIQNANTRSWIIMEQATRIYVHHTRHQWAQAAMRASGASEEEIQRMPDLDVGEAILIA